MTLKELETALKDTGYAVAYREFQDVVPTVPYITWTVENERHYGSDMENHVGVLSVTVELYSNKKDPDAEKKIESILSGVEFDKTETAIPEEQLLEIIYEFDLYTKY